MPTAPVSITNASEIRNIVWGANAETQKVFGEHFGVEIEKAIQILGDDAYANFQTLQDLVVLDERTATVQLFIHVALSSGVASIHHLVSGYPIAADHMMRHFTESISMALMCSNEATGVYQKYIVNRKTFQCKTVLVCFEGKKFGRRLRRQLASTQKHGRPS